MLALVILCTLASLVSVGVSTQLTVEFLLGQFPPCAVSLQMPLRAPLYSSLMGKMLMLFLQEACRRDSLAKNPLRSSKDVFGFCNDVHFLQPLRSCENENCSPQDFQRKGLSHLILLSFPVGTYHARTSQPPH